MVVTLPSLDYMTCIFCEIVAERAPASFVYRDEVVAAFMSRQPTAPDARRLFPSVGYLVHGYGVPTPISS